MRVVHLARFGGPYPGSFIAMIRAMAEESARRGWSCEAVFDPVARDRPWYGELSGEMPVRAAPPGGRRELAGFVAGVLDESDGPTVLHTHFTGFDLPAAAAARGRANAAVVWHLHTRLADGPAQWARNVAKFAVLGRGADLIVAAGPDIGEQARKRFARRVEVLPNAIDAARFGLADSAERARARAVLDLPPERPVVAHFGWDWEMKGGPLFLAAAQALRARGHDVVPLSVGASVTDDGLVTRPPTDDVRSIYAAADVFVSSSEVEGGPYSVLEALCTGTPVVASPRANAMAAGVVDACRIAERTPDAFAEAIAATLDRPAAQAAAEREAARDWVLRERDLRPWSERMADLYRGALR
jgi:glycosyltransferase involved in cell wall biosynthesis